MTLSREVPIFFIQGNTIRPGGCTAAVGERWRLRDRRLHGPSTGRWALREALAIGADDAYLLSSRKFGGSDIYATATIIAAALKKIGFDLVITGRQAIDGDTAQVGPQIGEQLGSPQVSYAEELDVEGDYIFAKRQFEDSAMS